ncbi:aspartic peptidase domain-containing protein [Truncatella angustata]|uniref:Aspartic peptidase domain-containing protein n=1 Tax=Truncatella angustata TaxID=152316 RepID=A0A9P8RHT7_9PEZI|nr:aspartic peptidase domain-containing protein [Truncatella angustata]KAH6646283.1 aspartic peptidase domain-containing protein [Truncatella angustata]
MDLQDGLSTTIPNVSMALISNAYASYPGGSWYPLSVGCLGIGAPDTVNQSFSTGGGPAINASLIPGYLSSQKKIASNSFGMHIGSANPKMAGSLYYGGYDQNRIVGEILTMGGTGDIGNELTLNDISISVIDGSSPWDFGTSQTGLLAEGNSSISGGLKTRIDGCSPYLTLPTSTCKAIAAHLPVTLNEDLGLYIWNTDDAKYTQIVNSASALNFTFSGTSNTDQVTIAVPFRHLNLTLEAPLVSSKTQYFPCYSGPSKQYTLGRAFLQDAFIGANWGSKTWFVAQAPGPNVPSPNIITLASGDKTIEASANDWKQSWSGSWKALTPAEVSPSATIGAATSTASSDTGGIGSTSSGLSTGAQAGIGVGVGLAALAGLGALLFFFLRRRRAAAKEASASSSPSNPAYPGAINSQTPQHGYYEPVKNPASPNMTQPTIYSPHQQHASVYQASSNGTYDPSQGSYIPPQHSGGYQQGYVQQGYPQQQYTAELPGGMSAAPQELPTNYQTQQNEMPTTLQTPREVHEAPGSDISSHR